MTAYGEIKLSELLERQNSHSSMVINHNQSRIDFWNKLNPKQTAHDNQSSKTRNGTFRKKRKKM